MITIKIKLTEVVGENPTAFRQYHSPQIPFMYIGSAYNYSVAYIFAYVTTPQTVIMINCWEKLGRDRSFQIEMMFIPQMRNIGFE